MFKSSNSYLLPFYYLVRYCNSLKSKHSLQDLRFALVQVVFDELSVAIDLYALATLHVVRFHLLAYALHAHLTDVSRQNGAVGIPVMQLSNDAKLDLRSAYKP